MQVTCPPVSVHNGKERAVTYCKVEMECVFTVVPTLCNADIATVNFQGCFGLNESNRVRAMRDMLRELEDHIFESTNHFREACARADHAEHLSRSAAIKSKGPLTQIAGTLRRESSDELARIATEVVQTTDQIVVQLRQLRAIEK